jgi:zinc protease
MVFIPYILFFNLLYANAVAKTPLIPPHETALPKEYIHGDKLDVYPTKVKELTSGRGIKFWFMKDNSAPLVHVKIAFKNSGAAHQEKTKAGIPIFYSNAVFCGSGKYSKTQFAEECSNLSLIIRCKADFDRMYFSLTIPKIVLDKSVAIFNALITLPNFENDKVKIIQNEIVSYLQNYAMDSSGIASHSIIPSIIFKSHKYESGIFGSPEDFMQLSVEDLKNYKAKFLVTSNVEACVFGDISESEATLLIDKIFSGVEDGKPSPDNIADVVPQLNSEIKKYYAEGPQSLILFVLKTERPRSIKRHAAMLLYKILGEGYIFKGRILSKLRTEKGLIYSGAVHHIDWNHSSYVLGKLQTDNSKVLDTINLLKTIVKDLREKGINESELQFAKRNVKGSILVNLRTSENLCNFYFNKKLFGFDLNALSETIEKINGVILKEVNTLANSILDENNMSFVVIGGKK